MTTLDQRLYDWLIEPDAKRFERAFSAYFAIAYPAVWRHLSRLSGWDAADLDDLAQEVLQRFFDRVGRKRREASDAMAAALGQLRPLDLGPFHARQVIGWKGDAGAFRACAMGFHPGLAAESTGTEWKASVATLTGRGLLLQRQGYHLLGAARDAAQWHGEGDANPDPDAVPDCAEQLAADVLARGAAALAAERRCPGFMSFVECTHTTIGALPLLRVPTNGLLFEIALTAYLDECKRRTRRKRGGFAAVAHTSTATGAAAGSESGLHPIDALTLDFPADRDGEEFPAHTTPDRCGFPSGPVAEDPTQRYEDEEFLEKFYRYLRRPLDAAREACEQAEEAGVGRRERHRLEQIANKFERTVAVLAAIGEGYTQDEAAARLGLSRNQIKYVIELVQESLERFDAPARRSPLGIDAEDAASHVR